MNKIITIIAIALLTTTVNAQEKNQKHTTNPVAQKPGDTLHPEVKPTEAQPILLKKKVNFI